MAKEFKHLMVDIETMGIQSYSSIISIGAVEFDIDTGETGKEFYTNITLESCMELGLTVNADTIMWWMKQSDDARLGLTYRGGIPIIQALQDFSKFCSNQPLYYMWGNAARFDLGLLTDAYNKAKLPIPWKYWNERCVRTLVSFNPSIKDNFVWKGTAHNALSDCYKQIAYCSEIWNSLAISTPINEPQVGMSVKTKNGITGKIKSCEDIHNVIVVYDDDKGEGLHCLSKDKSCDEFGYYDPLYKI